MLGDGQSTLIFGVRNSLIPIWVTGLDSIGCERVGLPDFRRQLNAGLFQQGGQRGHRMSLWEFDFIKYANCLESLFS